LYVVDDETAEEPSAALAACHHTALRCRDVLCEWRLGCASVRSTIWLPSDQCCSNWIVGSQFCTSYVCLNMAPGIDEICHKRVCFLNCIGCYLCLGVYEHRLEIWSGILRRWDLDEVQVGIWETMGWILSQVTISDGYTCHFLTLCPDACATMSSYRQ
jgi:hypothetical protein